MALAERRDCQDHVSVFVCSDWQLLRVGGALPAAGRGRLTPGVSEAPGTFGRGRGSAISWWAGHRRARPGGGVGGRCCP